ncbi:MAG: hypothetical protein FJ206_10740 [Gemmatimonadetes bacterium]|nr:hypothetical protein [Gemmatimonadota bacterium]
MARALTSRRRQSLLLGAIIYGGLASAPAESPAQAEPCLAVIGTGDMGGGIGQRLGQRGRRVVFGSRNPSDPRVQRLVQATGSGASAATPAEAAARCPHLLFAVPWEAAESAIRSLGDLTGKILLDVTNPLMVREGRVEALPASGSGSEQLRAWAPGVRVVKVFNTINVAVILDPALAGGPVSIPLSSDDPEAIAVAEEIVKQFGHDPVLVGGLATARYTEGMAMLYVNQLISRRTPFEFRLVPRSRPTQR